MKIIVSIKNYARVGLAEDEIEVVDYKEKEQTYDDRMNLIQEDQFDAEGTLIHQIFNDYDVDNHLIKSRFFDGDVLTQQNEFVYEEDKLVITKAHYGEGSPENCTHIIYENNLPVQEDDFNGDEFDHTVKRLYYEGTNLVKMIEYNDYEKADNIHTYTYDQDGNMLTHVIDEVQAKDKRAYEYEYENGKKVKELVYDYYDTLIAAKYSEYDEKGKLLEEETEDLDHYLKIRYEYENDVLHAVLQVNKEEKVVAKAEYEVDVENRVSKILNYALDEVNPANLRPISEISYERE